MNREMAAAEWRRAVKSLCAAEILMRSGYPEDAVSRCYYAVLHAAKSALFVHDVDTASHAAVRRMFGLHLVRSGEIEQQWASALARTMDDRLIADYSADARFSDQETRGCADRAKAFIERIRHYLLAKGLTDQELEPENRNG